MDSTFRNTTTIVATRAVEISPKSWESLGMEARPPSSISLDGKVFELVKTQRDGKSRVYKTPGLFLRIGEREKIEKDLALHKRMEESGFPVAKCVAEGESAGERYFIESSIGENHLGELFERDTEETGSIDREHFGQFVSVAEAFGKAQLKTGATQDFDQFEKGILLAEMCEELPDYAEALRARFARAKENLAKYPSVVTHGDFNPYNIYEKGVIDLEDSFYAPFGYDLVTGIVHIDNFPDSRELEFFAKYRFSPEQRKEYLARIDALSVDAGHPPISDHLSDFEFCRVVWLTVGLHKWPKVQAWKYNEIISKFLSD